MLRLAIVGRPNVGKSSLFNRICKGRIAIVAEIEGVTRDRLYRQTEVFGTDVELIDTGGLGSGPFEKEIRHQVEIAIEESDAIIFVVDGQVGMTEWDQRVARELHRTDRPIFLAVNKVDTQEAREAIYEFYGLGVEHIYAVSAQHGHGVADLLEEAIKVEPRARELECDGPKVAIVGRCNVGKSTLVNAILNEDRCVVSDQPGTTRDSVDVAINFNDKPYLLIDTAGIRKKKSEAEVVEKFASVRTERAIDRADICILVIDAQEGITASEKRILADIEEKGKGCALFFNKWDLVKGFRMEHCVQGARMAAPFLEHCPMFFGSALTGRNLDHIFTTIDQVSQNIEKRIGTSELNRFLERVMQLNHPPMIRGKRLRVYYMTQVSTKPTLFSLFINHPDRMAASYERYLYNQLRQAFDFSGVPFRFKLIKKKERMTTH
ncbi:MAG: ribosome biogenesis GTPase Der [Simkaniaceae bacterium]|nr:ribosome biogenesis GTPase Der [Simkaniaceae bacterium]